MAVAVPPDAVLAAVESLMEARRREGGFSASGGGRAVDHFTPNTRPTLATATEVATREAGAVSGEYPAATDAETELLVDVAALRAAVELEGSHYPEQVESNRSPARLWLDLLDSKVSRLDLRLGSPAQERTGSELAARWSFPGSDLRGVIAEGSEAPRPLVERRLQW